MASPCGPTFLTFNGKKYHPSLEWNEEEGLRQDPITHAPHSSKKDFKVSSFFCFFVGKFVDFMFHWELYGGTLSFCCCLFLWEFWTLYDLVWNHCVVMLFSLLWGIFELLSCLVLWNLDNVDGVWSFALYVACGIVGWILTWFLWVWNHENLMCMEIFLVCVGLIFMGMEILRALFSWVWKIFCVGHMFESLLNEFMEMRYYWVDWDIVWMSWNLNVWNGI